MSRILAASLPELGHLYPVIPTLLALESRGHEVLVVTGFKHVRTVENAGLAVRSVRTEVDGSPEEWQRVNPLRGGAEGAAAYLPIAEEVVSRLEEVVDDWEPDLILADPMWWPAVTVAEAAPCVWALFAHSPIFLPSRRKRPIMGDHRPLPEPLGWLRDQLASTTFRRRTRHATRTLNTLRARQELRPLSDAFAYLSRAPLVLAYMLPELAGDRTKWLPSVQFVGPGDWEQESSAPGWLAELDDRPLILGVTSSTAQPDLRVVETILEAFADEDVQVVATVPSGQIPDRVPANARVSSFVPHSLLLPKATTVICHGGLGIVQKAIGAGVPLVVVPFGRDQHHNSHRVEQLGVGVRFPLKRLSPEKLRLAVERAHTLRDRARQVSQQLDQTGGVIRSVEAVEGLLADQARRAHTWRTNDQTHRSRGRSRQANR